jgi:signal transduction histidine kinase
MAQVFANVLTNAVKHTPRGRIRVVVERQGRDAHVAICDDGPGIPDEKLASIFEPRIQLHARSKPRQANGAGLGLAIAQDIVQAHGGRIWAENDPSGGACFHVVWPLARARTRRGSASGSEVLAARRARRGSP